MGLKALSEELSGVIDGPRSPSSCCGNLDEMIRMLAHEAGLEESALVEAMKCESGCRSRYVNEDGSFKGDLNEGACKEMFSTCCSGVKDPEALCAYIGRRSGRT